ncbi:putative disease resistance protein RGA4 [Neltuma alba]|uniref:putative disease resistance protein RGA4 n=1 Tax=Neltuma alba TaxID=207710 RepID=UPI0010A34A94|nr:putative disease resistance protein RGA4 [Prosopis alba]
MEAIVDRVSGLLGFLASKELDLISEFRDDLESMKSMKLKDVLFDTEDLLDAIDEPAREAMTKDKMVEERQTHSFMRKEDVVGRDNERMQIVDILLNPLDVKSNVLVVAIVGIGGLEKTILAQQVYNDEAVKNHFELKKWVCVSDESNYEIEREILIRLWITEGFVQPLDKNRCLEDVGDEYFKQLLSRCLFQDVVQDSLGNIWSELPSDLKRLARLRHLELDGCWHLLHMPCGLGCLANLQTLATFIVDEVSSGGARIIELCDLICLRGNLEITNLRCQWRKVKEVESSKFLLHMSYLRGLALGWGHLHIHL